MLRFDVVFGLSGATANRRPSQVDAVLHFGDRAAVCGGSTFPS